MATILRQPLLQRLLGSGAFAFGGVVLAAGGIDEGGALLPLGIIGGLASLASAWRTFRLRVQLGPTAVTVVNYCKTLVIPWAEVERFGYDGGAWVRRRDRRQHQITAFTPSSRSLPFVHRQCREAARNMEERRKRRRRGGRDR